MQQKRVVLLLLILLLCCGLTAGISQPAKAWSEHAALETAETMLESAAYSKTELISQLTTHGFSLPEAVFAAENCGADWNDMAAKRAQFHINNIPLSRTGLIELLEEEGFTSAQAEFGTESLGADWNETAIRRARSHMETRPYTEEELIEQLIIDGFTFPQAVYGVSGTGISWSRSHADAGSGAEDQTGGGQPVPAGDVNDPDRDEAAIEAAQKLMESGNYSAAELIQLLIREGFTREKASYAARNSGIDWFSAAAQQAEAHLRAAYHTSEDLVELLVLDGFTREEAEYGASSAMNRSREKKADTPVDDSGMISETMVETLQNNLYLFFPIQSLKEAFTPLMEPVYSDLGPGTLIQTRNQNGVRKIKLFVNTDHVHDYRTYSIVNSGKMDNYLFSMDVIVEDVFPADQGGCFIAYTNEFDPYVSKEDAVMTALLANENGVEIYRKPMNADEGTHIPVPVEIKDSYRLMLVHLTGLTFVFVDEIYVMQYPDDTPAPFHLLYGTAVFSEGDNAYCQFDNLAIRKVLN